MVAVRINGEESAVGQAGDTRVADLIELIKASIDPEHIITSIMLDGRELEEQEWQANTSQFGTAIFEIETDTPEEYLNGRMQAAPDLLRACYIQFRDARKLYHEGSTVEGNRALVLAVNTLRAFFEWFSTLTEIMTEERRKKCDVSAEVREISEVCKRICQLQLYQSWWALGESLGNELEPKLDKLEDTFRKFARQIREGKA